MSVRTITPNEKTQFLNKLLQSGQSTEEFAAANGLSGRWLRNVRAEAVESTFGPEATKSTTPGGKSHYLSTPEIKRGLAYRNLTRQRKAATYGGKPVTQTVIAALTGSSQVDISAFERGVLYTEALAARYAAALGVTLVAVQQFGYTPYEGEVPAQAGVRKAKVTTDPIVFDESRKLTAYGLARDIQSFVGKTITIEPTNSKDDGTPFFVVRTGRVVKSTKRS